MFPFLPAAGDGRGGGDFDFGDPGGSEEEEGDSQSEADDGCSEDAVEGDDGSKIGAGALFGGGCETFSGVSRVCLGQETGAVWVEDEGVGEEGGNNGSQTGPCLGHEDSKSGLCARTAVDNIRVR